LETFIALLRGINVAGQKKIHMADLRSMFEALGLSDVQSYVQSGNVVFRSAGRDRAALRAAIEAQVEQTFGFAVALLLRDGADMQRIVDDNPFTTTRREDSARLYVTFLARQPSAARLAALAVPAGSADEFALAGEEIYLFCPNGYGISRLSNTFFEKKLDVPATTRNWNTVNALAKMASDR
jgi:uncharacterized protein (DUF1697 family)